MSGTTPFTYITFGDIAPGLTAPVGQPIVLIPPSGALAGVRFALAGRVHGAAAVTLRVLSGDGTQDYTFSVPANPLAVVPGRTFVIPITLGANAAHSLTVSDVNTPAHSTSVSFGVVAAGVSADGFAPGIYFPATVYAYSGGGHGQVLGTGFVRGLAGVPIISLTGPDVGTLYLTGTNGLTLYTGGLSYAPVQTSYSVTINATDGVTTLPPVTVTVLSRATALMPSGDPSARIPYGNFALDDALNGYYGNPDTNSNERLVTQYDIEGAWSGASATMSDPSGKFVHNASGTYVATAAAAMPLSGSYGAYPVTFTVPVSGGGTVTQNTTLWIIADNPPLVNFVPSGLALFDNMVAYSSYSQAHSITPLAFGQITAYADAGVSSVSITSPGNVFGIDTTNRVYVANTPVAGAGQVATIRVLGANGKATTKTVTFNVGVGTAGGTITPSFSTTLDNSMTSGTVGTLSVSGMSGTVTWGLIVQGDEIQELSLFGGGTQPRYTITSTGAATARIDFAFLSAQTDSLLITASDSTGKLAQLVAPLTVAAKAGPAVSVGSASDGSGNTYTYPTWNGALDAYWTSTPANEGMVITLHPQDYSGDFNRVQLGHGSNQQYAPGPLTIKGASAANRTLIDFKGRAPGLSAQGGIIAQFFDQVMQFIDVRNVTNINAGEGNAGGIYKTNQQPGNLTILDSAVSGCDINVMNGAVGTHLTLARTWLAFGGAGAGGLTHNFYGGHQSSVAATDVLSFSTAQVHEFKCRAARTTLLRCVLVDGENGAPGASACLDLPIGGIATATSCTFHKGPNPNNDGNMVQFCPEIGNGGLIEGNWPINTLVIDGCTFLNTSPPNPLSLSAGITGIAMFGLNGAPYASLMTGVLASVVYKNCQFYNLPRSQWAQGVAGGAAPIDGGGNTALTTWPGLLATDPATGALITNPPGPSYSKYVNSYAGIVIPPLQLELRAAASAAAGTVLTTATGYDTKGVALTGAAWTLVSSVLVQAAGSSGVSAAGVFALGPSSGVLTVAGTVANGLYFVRIKVVGTDSLSAAAVYEKYLYVIGGNGSVAAAA